ncbi:MAG: PLDc N-terminal domain-containing protein [Leeuwenhoekiella sp.]
MINQIFNKLDGYIPLFVIAIYLAAAVTIVFIWKDKNSKGTRFIWTIIIALLPLVGIFAYFVQRNNKKK